jgi:hypothetical protein
MMVRDGKIELTFNFMNIDRKVLRDEGVVHRRSREAQFIPHVDLLRLS